MNVLKTTKTASNSLLKNSALALTFIPFRKIAVSIGKNDFNIASKGKNFTESLKGIGVVLNRAQSKNRRLYAANTMEIFGKKVINSSNIEFMCYSKFRTLMHLWAVGLPIPKDCLCALRSVRYD